MSYNTYHYHRRREERHPLRRSRDGILWGVCKGLADWLGLSTGLVRIVFLILLAATGFFPLGFAYIIAGILIPLEEREHETYW